MRLYLVRHGESTDNVAGRYTGQSDPPLTPRGLGQAAALAGALAAAPLAAVYASPLRRAIATARILARPHGLPVHRRAGLKEVDMGEWTGCTYAELAARHPQELVRWLGDPESVAPPGGETLAGVRRRALAALAAVVRRHGGGPAATVAVVAHGGPLRAVLSQWAACPFFAIDLPPGSCWRVDWDGTSLRPDLDGPARGPV